MSNLTEGVKVTQQLLDKALNNPDFTFGFEAEFYVTSVTEILKRNLFTGASLKEVSGYPMYVKPLGKILWHDIIFRFEILDDNEEHGAPYAMATRLLQLYKSIIGGTKKLDSQMWEELKQQLPVYVLITHLKFFPMGELSISPSQIEAFKSMVQHGAVKEITPLNNLNDIIVPLYEKDELSILNIFHDPPAMNYVYSLIADQLSKMMGQPVLYSPQYNLSKQLTKNYTQWLLTVDTSLMFQEEKQNRLGCELISPVTNVNDGIQSLINTLNHFNAGLGEFQVETDQLTGLHINLGIKNKEIDTMKLLLLLGDKHIIDQFDRGANLYTHSLEAIVKDKLRRAQNKMIPSELVVAVREVLSNINITHTDVENVKKLLQDSTPVGNSYSINFKKLPEYVEFRAIGNRNYHKRTNDIVQAIHKMVAVTFAATEQTIFYKETLSKLYKMIINHITGPEMVNASVGMVGKGARGGYGTQPDPIEKTPYDGENLIQYGFNPGSETQ